MVESRQLLSTQIGTTGMGNSEEDCKTPIILMSEISE